MILYLTDKTSLMASPIFLRIFRNTLFGTLLTGSVFLQAQVIGLPPSVTQAKLFLYPDRHVLNVYPASILFNEKPKKGAVFCRMENHIREQYNVWMKIRAGDPDSYYRWIEKRN